MTDVFITHKCNLNCSYCFAKEHVNNSADEISIENFMKIINFNATEYGEKLGIVGGEPCLHSKFDEIINIVKNDDRINICELYTNGIELHNFVDLFNHKKFWFLINCNSPNDIGIEKYSKLEKSILSLSKINKQFSLGVNLYSQEQDYSFIFDLLKISDRHGLRFSLAIPNSIKEKETNVFEVFRKYKSFLNKFFQECFEHKIVPWNDCNAIPPCIMDNEDKKLQIKSALLAKEYGIAHNLISSTYTCKPILTIFPDMKATRSMCYPYCEKVPIEKFSTVEKLKSYMFNTVDIYTNLVFFKDECKNCYYRLTEKCGICKVYKFAKANQIKNYIMQQKCGHYLNNFTNKLKVLFN